MCVLLCVKGNKPAVYLRMCSYYHLCVQKIRARLSERVCDCPSVSVYFPLSQEVHQVIAAVCVCVNYWYC